MKHRIELRIRSGGPALAFQLAACLAVVVAMGTAARAENALTVGSTTVDAGSTADIPLRLSGDSDVQGFVMIFEWDSSMAKGVDVDPADDAGSALEGADLIEKRVEQGFIILAAVLDIDGQGGEKIPAGQDRLVGTAKIRCEGPTNGSRDVALKLVDGKYARVDGGPLLSNLISIGGRSIGADEGLRLHNGTLTCKGEGQPSGEVMFACGGTLDDNGLPKEIRGSRETRHKVNFYYKAPKAADKIQGFSMAVTYSCDLEAIEDSLALGNNLADTDPEFVHLEADNQPIRIDDDGCEFTMGVLIDAKSPFDGRTLPITTGLKILFSLEFLIENDADCGKCYWLKFMDGLNGNGTPPVKNLVSIEFQSRKPQSMPCSICVDGGSSQFIRGDCNLSNMGAMAVDIADAAAMVGYFFLTGANKFNAPCDDACDANDDGRLDASDIVFILNYMFVPKSPKPPAPGPTSAGTDPTNDNLGCTGGANNC